MKKIFIVLVGLVSIPGIYLGTDAGKLFTHAQSVTHDPLVTHATPIPQRPAAPAFLHIPKIHVAAAVESVGMDASGRMDVPKNDEDVAWYNLGYRPGENGGAVIDGHLDKVTGAPAVFWNLKELSPGDLIYVTDTTGHQRTFSVVHTTDYPWDQLPIKQVFGSSSVPMLNLITCQGVWDKTKKNYSNRMVVYAQLKNE